jgi:hypothetical protein
VQRKTLMTSITQGLEEESFRRSVADIDVAEP